MKTWCFSSKWTFSVSRRWTDLESECLEGEDGHNMSLPLGVRCAVREDDAPVAVHGAQQGQVLAHALTVLQRLHLVQPKHNNRYLICPSTCTLVPRNNDESPTNYHGFKDDLEKLKCSFYDKLMDLHRWSRSCQYFGSEYINTVFTLQQKQTCFVLTCLWCWHSPGWPLQQPGGKGGAEPQGHTPALPQPNR